MIFNHKVGVLHRAIKELFNETMVPKKFHPISQHYQTDSVIMKSEDVNVFAARYFALLSKFSENRASVFFKANYKDIA